MLARRAMNHTSNHFLCFPLYPPFRYFHRQATNSKRNIKKKKDEKLLQGHWVAMPFAFYNKHLHSTFRDSKKTTTEKNIMNYWRYNIAVFLNYYSPSGMRRIRWFASTPQGVGYLFLSLYYFFSSSAFLHDGLLLMKVDGLIMVLSY